MDSLTFSLYRELTRGKVMIIITGISGSGKSTKMRKLQEVLSKGDATFLSVDDFKVREYEKYGFRNIVEKDVLKGKAINSFKAEVIINARAGNNIITEYPFAVKWQPFFDYIHDEYGYRLVIVNCNTRDFFGDIWPKKVHRDFNEEERPRALISDMYLGKNNYIPSYECSDADMHKLHNQYINNYYNSIKGDVVYNGLGWKEEHITC